ncbi:probable 2-oxoglutarate-dependent dioxygenase At3g111800 [Bradysia coprophila]|uniref:probable 2-oxoglutarate-dependent dioxygenase At3g111800 n=1 Tax=Bradysia coprophila TaxID=38358 RepID=UPI00187D72BF|nr:probable 2-oxoglutarate-dependent dioxygenase At3g111800 [Bradysia coprophila]
MGSLSVPIIDISSLNSNNSTDEIDRQIHKACEEWGFFYVINHGVDLELIQQAVDLGLEFFNLPKELKNMVARSEKNLQGYSDSELTKRKVDWKEVFDFTPDVPDTDGIISIGVHGKNQWPTEPVGFERTMKNYLMSLQKLSRQLLRSCIKSISNEVDIVDNCFDGTGDTSLVRLNFYRRCPNPELHLGVGPHSDPGIITILLQDNSVSSLQVLKDGTFYDVPPVKDSFVVNIGDMMEVFSNGKYKAPVHRVLTSTDSDRFSLPYFLAPSYSFIIRPLKGTYNDDNPPKFRSFPWAEFRKGRYEGDFADKGEEIQITRYKIL